MGKAQSKRSVDITTETKKSPEGGEEVTGKLEKIEDIDQKQVNGDATPHEKGEAAAEKKSGTDEPENEKDLTTEKAAEGDAAAASPPTDGSGDQSSAAVAETSPKEDGNVAVATTPAKEGEEITPLADESINKKSKKEKVKKKWSLRSISFGKKDKQKPAKTEEVVAAETAADNAAVTTNGEAPETNKSAEETGADGNKQEAPGAAAEVNSTEAEKVVATEKEQPKMNGHEKTPSPSDDAEQKKPTEQTSTTAATNETATTAAVAVAETTTAVTSQAASNETANEIHTEKKSTIEPVEPAAPITNGTADAEKNGDAHPIEQLEEKISAPSEENSKTIPADEKPHQNGTNGDEAVDEITAATKTLQIEVKTEQTIDSLNSTPNTTTITTDTVVITPTTTIITTTPDDSIGSEQKKTTSDIEIITSSTHTDTNTNNNTSDKPSSSEHSIANTEEIRQTNQVLDSIEDNSIAVAAIETTETKLTKSDEDADIGTVQQPPPLPISAPPSQVAIFALRGNETTCDEIGNKELNIEVISLAEEKPTNNEQDEENVELIECAEIKTEMNSVEISFNPYNEETQFVLIETEITSSGAQDLLIEDITTNAIDEIEAEAIIIVDQIQKELEKQDETPQEILNEIESEEKNIVSLEIINPPNGHENDQKQEEFIVDQGKEETISIRVIDNKEQSDLVQTENVLTQVISEENGTCQESPQEEFLKEQEEQQQQDDNQVNESNIDHIVESNRANDVEVSDSKIIDFSLITEKISNLNIENVPVGDENNTDDDNDIDGNNCVGMIVKEFVDEFVISSSNKEMPTAKDLKENAAAAEVTQDLPVTCE